MKNLLIFTLFVFLLQLSIGCENTQTQSKPLKSVIIKKVVKAKNQSEQTSYHYKYNLWKGNFYHQPDIHSVYYIVYTDGSYESVDIGKYSITNIGDTIKQVIYQ